MDRDDKYLDELTTITDEIQVIIKRIALQIKNGIEPTEDREIYNQLMDKKRTLVKEYTDANDREILKRCIKKEELVDGAWYETDKEGQHVARYVNKAQWIKKDDHFLAPGQQQFGMDGYLDYFGDVIDTRMAGFPPMKKVE